MSRLAREHPEDDSYQTLEGQYERLVEPHDLGAGDRPYSIDIDDKAKAQRHIEHQEALGQESREGAW